MKASQTVIVNLLLIIVLANSISAKVALSPFREIIKDSDTIVLGKVTRVMECYQNTFFDNLKLAEFEVTQVIKGKSELTLLHFWASPSWACDISNAQDGQTLLLMLDQDEAMLSVTSNFSSENQILVNHLREYLQGRPIFSIAYSGGGRMIIENNLIEENGYIDYPQNFKVMERRPAMYSYDAFYNFDQVMRYVNRQVSMYKKHR